MSEVPNRRALRICHVVPYDLAPEGGGVKQHALHLASALRRLGDEVTIIGPASAQLTDQGLQGFAGVVNIPSNGSDNMLGLLVSPIKIWRFFRRHHFDVVHLHEPQSPLLPYWCIWATGGTARVATFHAYAESQSLLWLRRLIGRLLFPRLQRAIAVSSSAARYAAASWKRPLTIIPNGVPTAMFCPDEGTSADARALSQSNTSHQAGAVSALPPSPPPLSPDAPSTPLRLLFVGRLADRRKGARTMLAAYARLCAAGASVTLDMIGEIAHFAPRPQLPGLTLWDQVTLPALIEHYRSCDIFVAPSTGQESFGIILLEAMACGKPVICSDIDGYRDVIGGAGAILVPPDDVDALETALWRLLRAPTAERAALGATNLAAAQAYDWDRLVHRVRAEYLAAIDAAA